MAREDSGLSMDLVGLGARTAVGASALAASAAVRAAVSSFGDHPFMIDKAGAPMTVARDAFLPPEATAEERFIELAVSAAAESLEWLDPVRTGPIRLHLLLGLPSERPGLPPGLGETLWKHLKPVIQVRTKPAGGLYFFRCPAIQPACWQHSRGAGSARECLFRSLPCRGGRVLPRAGDSGVARRSRSPALRRKYMGFHPRRGRRIHPPRPRRMEPEPRNSRAGEGPRRRDCAGEKPDSN